MFRRIALALLLGASPVTAAELPAVDAPAFAGICDEMYGTLDAGNIWPAQPSGARKFCTLETAGAEPVEMSGDDYAWALRKSLKFACKGRREVIYEVMRRLGDCAGGNRTLDLAPIPDGGCRVNFRETGSQFEVEPELIDDLLDWRADMPWYEAVLVALFAPRELPMLMDGLIGCGAGRAPS